MQNRPDEALIHLENATADDPAHVQAFLYLGLVYQQLGRYDDAAAVYLKILPRAGAESARVAFNLGNVYFSMGNMEAAAQYFSQALQIEPSMSSAWLNRANSRIKTGSQKEAVNDYEQYLLMEPESAQREEIERLIAFIREETVAEEQMRSLQTENPAPVELDRKQRLMEEVAASLMSFAEDSRNLSSWAEDLETLESRFDDDFDFQDEIEFKHENTSDAVFSHESEIEFLSESLSESDFEFANENENGIQ